MRRRDGIPYRVEDRVENETINFYSLQNLLTYKIETFLLRSVENRFEMLEKKEFKSMFSGHPKTKLFI